MTQKELSYVEDAIGHEGNIIEIINNMLKKTDDENTITFLNNELDKHNNIKKNLISKLEEKANE